MVHLFVLLLIKPDIYGKIWHAWDQVGNSNSEQLKPWLDPANTNAISLNGIYCNQSASVTAAFNSSATNVCLNSSVTYSSLSSGEINSYNWQFLVVHQLLLMVLDHIL